MERGGFACDDIIPAKGECDAVLARGGGVGVAGFRRDGDGLGRAVGLGTEGWGGGVCCSCGGVSAFRVGCAGAGGCCGAVLYGICCRICVAAVFGPACVAARGDVGLRLLFGGILRLNRLRDGCRGHRRADHGRARDRAE